jgi:hypothetical protein
MGKINERSMTKKKKTSDKCNKIYCINPLKTNIDLNYFKDSVRTAQ